MARRNERVKGPNVEMDYTPEQLMEIARCVSDIVYFCIKYVKVQHPVRGSIPFKLYPYQIKMLRAYQDERYVVVLSARQTGKALALDTQIPTPTGWTTMGEIRPDDWVLGADGTPVRVIRTSNVMKNHNCYELTFCTGDTVIADAEHLWEVRDEYTHKTKILTTQDMVDVKYVNEKNQARFTVKTTKAIELPTVGVPIDPYTLGVWLGDGTSRCGELTLHEADLSILDYITEFKHTVRNRVRDVKRITLHGLYPKLNELGVRNNKHIPNTYKRASYEQRLALLQGLMDTGGTVDGLGRGQCDITLANETLAFDVYELVNTLGLKSKITKRVVNGFVRWEIKFSAYRLQQPVFRLERKLKLMKDAPASSRVNSTKKRSIQQIKKVDSVPVKCITVDNEDHLFLFGTGMIPTHNSITSAIYLLWRAMFFPDQNILIASNKNAGAMEMVARIKHAYEELPFWLKAGVVDWNKHTVLFDNKSKIDSVATSEDAGRGKSISLLFLDEFAFVKPGIQTEFWSAILPTLSTGGSCIMTSTPNGDCNLFANIWRSATVGASAATNGGNAMTFFPIQVKWDEPPGRDETFKKQQIVQLGELLWRQEYLCEFLSSDALLIDSVKLQHLTTELESLPKAQEFYEFKVWEEIRRDENYIIGVDPATGTGQDFTVIQVFHFPSLRQVAEFRDNTTSSPQAYVKLKWIIKQLEQQGNQVYFSVENNGIGEGVIALYMNDEEQPELAEFVSSDRGERLGFATVGRSKMKACLDFKQLFETNKMKIRSNILLSEMKNFVRKRDSYEAQEGSTDDAISATLVVIRILSEIAEYEQSAFEMLYTVDGDDYDSEGEEDYLPVLV